MKNLGGILLIGAGLFVSLNLLHAQTASVGSINGVATPIQAAPPDSIVQATAQAQGLPLVASADLPAVGGTFWLVTTNGIAAPSPCPPGNLSDFPVYQMVTGIFLVDETGGQVVTNADNGGTTESALAAEADAVVNLINQVQNAQAAQLNSGIALDAGHGAGVAMMMADSSSMMTPAYDTNGLWLEMTNIANGWSYFNLHNSTNVVYAILSTTSLAGGTWNVETELFPTLDQTNVLPFSVQNFDRQNLFLKAMDWTGVTENGNTVPDWWLWEYYGTTALSDTNLDSGGVNPLVYDYTNGYNPNIISFTPSVANNYVNNMAAAVQLAVTGNPYYIAVSVDDTNYAADAVWNPYTSPNVTVNLGITEGWHDVWIGLRGHADDTNSAVWQWQRLKLDFTPPSLVITSPTNSTVNVPVIQLTGYSSEALSSVAYDVGNATGIFTDQQVLVEDQFYDTNTFEFTTNYFQAYDVPLTNGLNVITLHATDLAGNLATLTTNINYVPTTNPPAVNLVWPQDGMQISGSNLTIQGQMDDPTATVTVAVVDANGNTNTFNGLTGRDGNFWIENVPLNAGTNLLTVAVANLAGVSTTTLNLYQSSVNLTINAVVAGDTNVEGSIDTDGYTVWVNGIEATDNGDDTWTAQITPIGIGGGLVIAEAVPDGNNFISNSRLAGRFQSMQDSNQDPDIYAGNAVQPPQGVFVSAYQANNFVTAYGEDSYYTNYNSTHWENGLGGNSVAGMTGNGYTLWQDESAWPSNTWPQPLPDGTMEIYGEDGNTNVIAPIGLPEEHCDINEIIDGNGTVDRRTADTEMKLATGGPLGSTQKNLWVISATATDTETGLPIPSEQIEIGTFGKLDTNGNMFVMLPDNDPDGMSVKTPWKHFTFTVSGKKYPQAIMANYTMLSGKYLWPNTDFCVGQAIYFTVVGLPQNSWAWRQYEFKAKWTLPGASGAFVNRQPDTNCLAFYDEDTNLLTVSSLTDAALTTPCWYVQGLPDATVTVTVSNRLGTGPWHDLQTISGKFNVHRPTTAQATPYQPHGVPVIVITNRSYGILWGQTINNTLLSLSLGDGNQHNDMSFSNTITTDGFCSGHAGYLQLITGGDVIADTYQMGITNIGLDNKYGEFPRGTPDIPTNMTTGVLFYDAPAVPLANMNLNITSEDLEFSTYLMFMPDGGPGPNIFVPLRLITWQLHDQASHNADDTWTPRNSTDQGTTTTIPLDYETTSFPRWTKTY